MPTAKINGINIFYELTGTQGSLLVLVHGSWGDHHNWDAVVGELSKTFRVVTYDRRGHSLSERLPGQGYIHEDVLDLIALVEYLKLAPAYIAGNSCGASIVLKAAAKRPDFFQALIIHEPPLFGLLKKNPDMQGLLQNVEGRMNAVLDILRTHDNEAAAKLFIDTLAFGPGAWDQLPPAMRQTFTYNAPTWYDEMQDPDSLQMDLNSLSGYKKPALFSIGDQSPPFFAAVIERLMTAVPHAKRITIEGAGHVPHVTTPEKYVEVVKEFCSGKHR
jgi:pimeloyl-ACP methyl ester carboxylesterase